MNEFVGNPEIGQDLLATMLVVEDFLDGKFPNSYPDSESLDPRETFSGPLLDLNDPELTPYEKEIVSSWIEKRVLKDNLENAPIGKVLLSPDGETTVRIYSAVLVEDEFSWYLSVWQNKGEKPSFILWPEDVYDWQEEEGYTVVEQP